VAHAVYLQSPTLMAVLFLLPVFVQAHSADIASTRRCQEDEVGFGATIAVGLGLSRRHFVRRS
jgi:hypothetical protein